MNLIELDRDKLNLILHEMYEDGSLVRLQKAWWAGHCSHAPISVSCLSPLIVCALVLLARLLH